MSLSQVVAIGLIVSLASLAGSYMQQRQKSGSIIAEKQQQNSLQRYLREEFSCENTAALPPHTNDMADFPDNCKPEGAAADAQEFYLRDARSRGGGTLVNEESRILGPKGEPMAPEYRARVSCVMVGNMKEYQAETLIVNQSADPYALVEQCPNPEIRTQCEQENWTSDLCQQWQRVCPDDVRTPPEFDPTLIPAGTDKTGRTATWQTVFGAKATCAWQKCSTDRRVVTSNGYMEYVHPWYKPGIRDTPTECGMSWPNGGTDKPWGTAEATIDWRLSHKIGFEDQAHSTTRTLLFKDPENDATLRLRIHRARKSSESYGVGLWYHWDNRVTWDLSNKPQQVFVNWRKNHKYYSHGDYIVECTYSKSSNRYSCRYVGFKTLTDESCSGLQGPCNVWK